MESLVGYGSDEESRENYQDIKMDGRDRLHQGEEDCNYDNVQMDMSEESNNNNSGSSNEDYKSPTRSSISRSSTPSSQDSVSSDEKREMKSVSPMRSKVTSGKTEGSKSQNGSSKHKEQDIRGKNERNKREGSNRYEEKDRLHHDIREKVRPRQSRDKSRERERERERLRRDERRSKSRSRERERDRRRSRSRDRSKRSRSPPDRHPRKSDKSSRYKRSPRSHERERERRSPPGLGSSSRVRSHSRDRDRDRDRDRGKSSSSSSGSSRRGGYEKKPSKLTILERLGIELRPPEAPPAVTPQQLLQKSIEQQVQQVKSNTGIELPKYYNPAAMNPARYAEQMQKRKLLWGNKSQEGKAEAQCTSQQSNNKWEGTTFAQDQDGRMTAKFKRLMGIKDSGQGASAAAPSTSNQDGNEILKKQEELFTSMEMQYEVARVATHTHRGVGLGFGTFQYPR